MTDRPQPLTAYPVSQALVPEPEPARPADLRRGERPRILLEMMSRLNAYLADPAPCLPTLNAANGSARQQRLERRVACVQLLRALLNYLDLASLRVGIPQRDGGFLNLTMPFLAKHARLPLRRAERAMRDLLRAGLVKAQQRCEQAEDGAYRGLAALRQVPAALFGAFGLAKWLRHERSKAVMRRYRATAENAKERRQRARDTRAEAHASLALAAVMQRVARRHDASRPVTPAAGQSEHVARRVGLLKAQHPDWDRDRCYAVAYQELSSTEGPARR